MKNRTQILIKTKKMSRKTVNFKINQTKIILKIKKIKMQWKKNFNLINKIIYSKISSRMKFYN